MSPFNEEQPLSPSEPVAPFPSPSTRPRPRDTIGRLFASYDSDDEGDIENPFEVSGFDHIATVSHPLSEDLPNNHQQPPLSTTRASSTTSSSLKEPWSPPPRSTSTTSARAPPSSSSSGGGQQHLRQRSIPSSRGVRSNDNPFADTYGNQVMRERERGREPPNAAMLDDHGLERAVHTSAASTAMRGGNAEWIPIQQHLYSETNPASRILGSNSSHSSSNHNSLRNDHQSQSRYDLSILPTDILSSYSKLQEKDDPLHDPLPVGKREGRDRRIVEVATGNRSGGLSMIGFMNLLAVSMLFSGLVMLFAGYPIYSYFTTNPLSNFGAAGIGGTNASGQVPDVPSYRGLIDKDTPNTAMTRTGFDGKAYQLVFSDEFNTPGRTFGSGEDPYWEAVDLHYHQTNDLEWYTPDNIITKDGYLAISLTQEALEDSHNLGFLGGMLQSWNKFCFTGGYVEVAVSLPGSTNVSGLWPAAWTMSNLGRAGYGGSLDGTWPYVYEECDIGTLANQTDPKTGGPSVTTTAGDPSNGGSLSYLPGQRLSACTCPGENHPGPVLANGSFVGRGASEIDIFEATVNEKKGTGSVSQSAQWAPFNPNYEYLNTSSEFVEFFQTDFNSKANSYLGGAFQQVTSGLSTTDPTTYNSTTNFQTYGFEYTPTYIGGFGTGKITWCQAGQAMWRISDTAMAANAESEVSNRVVTGEPMYILLNLGMSENFGKVDLTNLVFPAVLRVDYVRVYQDTDQLNIGCDPPLYPTADYIANNLEAYQNPNITVVGDLGQTFPKNRLIDTC